jgi:hypothetical protein
MRKKFCSFMVVLFCLNYALFGMESADAGQTFQGCSELKDPELSDEYAVQKAEAIQIFMKDRAPTRYFPEKLTDFSSEEYRYGVRKFIDLFQVESALALHACVVPEDSTVSFFNPLDDSTFLMRPETYLSFFSAIGNFSQNVPRTMRAQAIPVEREAVPIAYTTPFCLSAQVSEAGDLTAEALSGQAPAVVNFYCPQDGCTYRTDKKRNLYMHWVCCHKKVS